MRALHRLVLRRSDRDDADAPAFAPHDRLTAAIHEVLDEGVIELGEDFWGGGGRYNGYCFRACEAYHRLVRDPDPYYRSLAADSNVKLRYHSRLKKGEKAPRGSRGHSHYWLVNSEGAIIDLTLAKDEKSSYKHYLDELVRGRGIPNPSKDATRIIEAVKARHPSPDSTATG